MYLTEYNKAWLRALFKEEGRMEEKHAGWIRAARMWRNDPQANPKGVILNVLDLPEALFDRIADFLARHSDLDDAAAAEQFPWQPGSGACLQKARGGF